MQKLSKISRIFLSLSVIFFAVWYGGYISRHILIYRLFEPENLALQPMFNMQNLAPVFDVISTVLTLNLIAYPVFLITFAAFLFTSKISLKKEGWLFIITALIFITAPFEIYLMTFDLKIALKTISSNFSVDEILAIIKERMTVLSSFSLIELFCYAGALFILVFQPLKQKKNEN